MSLLAYAADYHGDQVALCIHSKPAHFTGPEHDLIVVTNARLTNDEVVELLEHLTAYAREHGHVRVMLTDTKGAA